MTTPLSFRVSDQQAQKLDDLCKATERDRTYHMTKALEEYIGRQQWHLVAIKEGIASADKGELTSIEEVRLRWEERRNARIDRES